MSGTLHITSVSHRDRFMEHLVSKRTRELHYLISFHRGNVMWLNAVRVSPADLTTHFATHGAITPETVRVEEWLSARMPRWALMAISLSELLQLPIDAAQFVTGFYHLLLELDVVCATGTTSRLMAERTLRNYVATQENAWWKGSSVPPPDVVHVSRRFHTIISFIPTYMTLIIPFCMTLLLAYSKMGDVDAFVEASVVLSIDKRIKHEFFGPLSRELTLLAQRCLKRSIISMQRLVDAEEKEGAEEPSTFPDAVVSPEAGAFLDSDEEA